MKQSPETLPQDGSEPFDEQAAEQRIRDFVAAHIEYLPPGQDADEILLEADASWRQVQDLVAYPRWIIDDSFVDGYQQMGESVAVARKYVATEEFSGYRQAVVKDLAPSTPRALSLAFYLEGMRHGLRTDEPLRLAAIRQKEEVRQRIVRADTRGVGKRTITIVRNDLF